MILPDRGNMKIPKWCPETKEWNSSRINWHTILNSRSCLPRWVLSELPAGVLPITAEVPWTAPAGLSGCSRISTLDGAQHKLQLFPNIFSSLWSLKNQEDRLPVPPHHLMHECTSCDQFNQTTNKSFWAVSSVSVHRITQLLVLFAFYRLNAIFYTLIYQKSSVSDVNMSSKEKEKKKRVKSKCTFLFHACSCSVPLAFPRWRVL